jgi:hypothetical protein
LQNEVSCLFMVGSCCSLLQVNERILVSKCVSTRSLDPFRHLYCMFLCATFMKYVSKRSTWCHLYFYWWFHQRLLFRTFWSTETSFWSLVCNMPFVICTRYISPLSLMKGGWCFCCRGYRSITRTVASTSPLEQSRVNLEKKSFKVSVNLFF